MIAIALSAVLNRARGDDRWMPAWLPGRALWYVAPVMGALAWWATDNWLKAMWFSVAYLIWAVPSWGHWIDLGRKPVLDRKPDRFERAVDYIANDNDHVALFIRHLLVLPAAILLPYGMIWTTFIAAAFVLMYEISWRVTDKYPIVLAEILVGALWGVMILVM